MGEPRFDRSKRYVDKKGRKFGKGVWVGYNRVIQPGWGDFNRDNRTVTQYNTDGTKTVYSWEQWQDKKTKDHELKVLQNDRKYAIPFIPSKKMTITIDKNSPTRKNAGAVLSENLLDSVATNAGKARIPFSTALGIVAQESTLGNNPSRTAGKSMLPWLYVLNNSNGKLKNAASSISYGNVQSPSLLISNWKRISENPFASYNYDGQGDLLKEKRNDNYYTDYFNSDLRKSNKYKMRDTSPLFHGFRSYKKDPYNYNPGDPNYPNKVEAQKNELTNYSPEIKAYMKKHNLKADGGYLNNNWDSLSMKDKAEMMKVAIANGITTLPEIRQAYNEFAKGGRMKWTMQDEAGYKAWRSRLPKNLRETNDNDYDMRAAYKAGMEPQWNNEDKSYHLGSRDPQSGRILKSPHHPTFLKALATDASLGYYPTTDSNGNTYTETWEGNHIYAKGGKLNNSQKAMNYLMGKGISKTGASAIVGTLQAESNLNPAIHAQMKGDNGEGIAQWTGSRKKVFWNTLEKIEPGAQKKYGSIVNVPLERQLDVVLAERPDVTRAIHGAKDVHTATDIMLRGYENGGGTVNTMASKGQMDRIYGKWNNGYNNQMKKRLGNAGNLLGIQIDPSSYQLSQGYFDNINGMINTEIPQMSIPDTMNVDPSTLYKAPIIDDTLFANPKSSQPEVAYNPQEEKLDNLQRFNMVMGLMGESTPFSGLIGESSTPGLMSYVNAIYS